MKSRAYFLSNAVVALIAVVMQLGSLTASAADSKSNIEFGPDPQLPEPKSKLVPTMNVAPAKPWSQNEMPTVASGLKVSAYARGLNHPRWLYVLPNDDVLVAENNAPTKQDSGGGIKDAVKKKLQEKAGAATPSADRIVLLRGINQDGTAKIRTVFLQGLHSPFGMALVGNNFYVANTDAIVQFPYRASVMEVNDGATKIIDLPAGSLNHHWTKNIIASRDGSKLYVTVGSNSNIAENGFDQEEGRAAIHEVDLKTKQSRLYATGLRNPNGLAWNPQTGLLWSTVNERDELGDNLVPDYMTSVRDGGFYGWPYSYFGANVDERVKPANPELVAKALKPDYALGAHTASLGLAFYEANALPKKYSGGAFVGQHGSWNRKPHSGYKVVFIPFVDGHPSGSPEDVLTGFLDENNNARGRPVGVAIDNTGALLVADDVGNAIWRVTAE